MHTSLQRLIYFVYPQLPKSKLEEMDAEIVHGRSILVIIKTAMMKSGSDGDLYVDLLVNTAKSIDNKMSKEDQLIAIAFASFAFDMIAHNHVTPTISDLELLRDWNMVNFIDVRSTIPPHLHDVLSRSHAILCDTLRVIERR